MTNAQPANPASSVRGPSHVVKRGKTPVLSPEEARRVLDAIDVSTHAGLRDRALIALMVFSFARIGAALAMKVEDVFVQNRRLWVGLREKGGKRHEMPCHHNLETYLHAYRDGSGISADPKGPLFRTIGRTTGLTFTNSDTGQGTQTRTATLRSIRHHCKSPPQPTSSLPGRRAVRSHRHLSATRSAPQAAA
jgi:integrase